MKSSIIKVFQSTKPNDMFCLKIFLFAHLFILEPINTFHGTYKTDDEPIRLSYHRNVHYNSVINPFKATVGVGLGLPGFQPGVSTYRYMEGLVVTVGLGFRCTDPTRMVIGASRPLTGSPMGLPTFSSA